MRERPILFSGPMVRAIIEGRKTVTRRAIKHQPDAPVTDAIPRRDYPHGPATVDWYWRPQHGHLNGVPSNGWNFKCPYGQPGDRLWVRETFAIYGDRKMAAIHYRADRLWDVGRKDVGYKPSIHMPRWASRVLLEVTDVRVERLLDITEEQARAEGMLSWTFEECDGDPRLDGQPCTTTNWHWEPQENECDGFGCAQYAFHGLWNSINGPGAWEANPWVWVVEFKRVQP